jgi:hypothetical protein
LLSANGNGEGYGLVFAGQKRTASFNAQALHLVVAALFRFLKAFTSRVEGGAARLGETRAAADRRLLKIEGEAVGFVVAGPGATTTKVVVSTGAALQAEAATSVTAPRGLHVPVTTDASGFLVVAVAAHTTEAAGKVELVKAARAAAAG